MDVNVVLWDRNWQPERWCEEDEKRPLRDVDVVSATSRNSSSLGGLPLMFMVL